MLIDAAGNPNPHQMMVILHLTFKNFEKASNTGWHQAVVTQAAMSAPVPCNEPGAAVFGGAPLGGGQNNNVNNAPQQGHADAGGDAGINRIVGGGAGGVPANIVSSGNVVPPGNTISPGNAAPHASERGRDGGRFADGGRLVGANGARDNKHAREGFLCSRPCWQLEPWSGLQLRPPTQCLEVFRRMSTKMGFIFIYLLPMK